MSTRTERSNAQRLESTRRGAELQAAAAATAGLPAVDRAHLGRYTLGCPKLEREIMGLFLAQLPLSIEQLRFSVTDREWQIAAHTIKGSARAVGAWHVGRLAFEAEKMPGDGEDERAQMLDALEEAFEAVQTYVAEAFPPEPPRA